MWNRPRQCRWGLGCGLMSAEKSLELQLVETHLFFSVVVDLTGFYVYMIS